MRILAIDPGPTQSACLSWDGGSVQQAFIQLNESIRTQMPILRRGVEKAYDVVAIEMVACYGMPVGKEVFETCVWIGRFMERLPDGAAVRLVYRLQVKNHLCHSPRAKDANIRQAIIDRFGGKEAAIGRKSAPGPLYGVKSHLWAALAVALYVQDHA